MQWVVVSKRNNNNATSGFKYIGLVRGIAIISDWRQVMGKKKTAHCSSMPWEPDPLQEIATDIHYYAISKRRKRFIIENIFSNVFCVFVGPLQASSPIANSCRHCPSLMCTFVVLRSCLWSYDAAVFILKLALIYSTWIWLKHSDNDVLSWKGLSIQSS